ncbi:MAG TPA: hypothetical protein VIC08_14620 [Cellvibrionaceae bacterium]
MASQYEMNDETEIEQDADDMDLNDDELSASDSDKNQPLEDFNIASRQKLREELSQQIEAFLAGGGKINEVATPMLTDRPSKPASEYSDRLM